MTPRGIGLWPGPHGAAGRDASRLRSLVYLDAYLPNPGESEADIWPPKMATDAKADLAAGRTHRSMPPMSFFGLDGSDAEWAQPRLTPQPLKVYLEPAIVSPLPPLPARYIHCARGPLAEIFEVFARRARERGWPVDELQTGHDAMLTKPKELAELLLRTA